MASAMLFLKRFEFSLRDKKEFRKSQKIKAEEALHATSVHSIVPNKFCFLRHLCSLSMALHRPENQIWEWTPSNGYRKKRLLMIVDHQESLNFKG